MGYSVSLVKNNVCAHCGHDAGGDEVELWSSTVTYNFSIFFAQMFGPDRLRALHGMKASDSQGILHQAIGLLGMKAVGNPWDVEPGNAGIALDKMCWAATQYPNAEWRVY